MFLSKVTLQDKMLILSYYESELSIKLVLVHYVVWIDILTTNATYCTLL